MQRKLAARPCMACGEATANGGLRSHGRSLPSSIATTKPLPIFAHCDQGPFQLSACERRENDAAAAVDGANGPAARKFDAGVAALAGEPRDAAAG
jgi:hypothetical protein